MLIHGRVFVIVVKTSLTEIPSKHGDVLLIAIMLQEREALLDTELDWGHFIKSPKGEIRVSCLKYPKKQQETNLFFSFFSCYAHSQPRHWGSERLTTENLTVAHQRAWWANTVTHVVGPPPCRHCHHTDLPLHRWQNLPLDWTQGRSWSKRKDKTAHWKSMKQWDTDMRGERNSKGDWFISNEGGKRLGGVIQPSHVPVDEGNFFCVRVWKVKGRSVL